MRVDFYLQETDSVDARWLLACRLAEKAYRLNHRVFIFCENEVDANYIDELLWSFKPESFIPHNLQTETITPPPPVQIGFASVARSHTDILINMTTTIPSFVSQFKRIMEIVTADAPTKDRQRAQFRAYRTMGAQLHTHKLDETAVSEQVLA